MDTKTILTAVGILFIVVVIKAISDFIESKRNASEPEKFYHKITTNDFRLRPSIMNSNEHLFFEQLRLAVGERYHIYPQVSLNAIFQPVKQWHNWGELSRLNKRIDFVLFNKNTQTPKVAIELDGDSHLKYKSLSRDEFVGQIFTKFNIPLIRFNNGNYSAEEIKSKLPIF